MVSKKKSQHLVPECYLQAFTTSEIPAEHQNNPKFEPGVWVAPGTLNEPWAHKHPRNLFRESYFYNLPGDDPSAPAIEELLSGIEKRLPRILEKIQGRVLPSPEEEVWLILFTSTLSLRTATQQSHWEEQLSHMRQAYRDVGGFDDQEQTGDLIADSDPRILARKLIGEFGLGRLLLEQGIQFVLNSTSEPFITSDNPVFHQQWHVDEAEWAFGAQHTADNLGRNIRRPLTFLPLSPRRAIASSTLLANSHQSFPWIHLPEASCALWLNTYSLVHAEKQIVSSRPKAATAGDARLREGVQNLKVLWEEGTYLQVYTASNRYFLRVDAVEHHGGSIRFTPIDLSAFSDLVADGELESIEVFSEGIGTALMTEIEFKRVDPTGSTPSEIGHKGGLAQILGSLDPT